MIRNGQPDADDLFADTRMSFGDHIEDLRKHLWRAIIGFFVAIVLSFTFSSYVLKFIERPIKAALKEFQAKREDELIRTAQENPEALNNQPQETVFEIQRSIFAQLLVKVLEQPAPPNQGAPPDANGLAIAKRLAGELTMLFPPAKEGEQAPDDWVPLKLRQRPADVIKPLREDPTLVVYKVTEGMMVWLEVSMICGLVLGSPWIFYQLWSFVAAGLYANEKRLVHVYMPFSLALFLAGVFVCEFLVIPQAVRFLLEFNYWLGVQNELRLEDWLSFALWVPVIFGLSFQTPLIMLFLAKIGIFDAASFRAKRRIAWFSLMVIAALVMPTTDVYTILMMQVPMIALYEVGILLAAYVDRQRKEEEVPDEEEMVGV
jgi:sec-independent protein translocase protein TatC